MRGVFLTFFDSDSIFLKPTVPIFQMRPEPEMFLDTSRGWNIFSFPYTLESLIMLRKWRKYCRAHDIYMFKSMRFSHLILHKLVGC